MSTASSLSESLDPALAALCGTVLESRYEVGRILGAGGMGAVFEATHLRLDRPVAIKVLRPVFVGHELFVKRFLREAKAASKIRQRNVVEILDYGEADGGLVYSVMELLHGQDLGQMLREQPEQRVSWAQAHVYLAQIAAGLKAAHSHGVIHRDIKPANCILAHEDDDVVVKIVDFGIAKVDGAEQTQQITSTAEVLGTPAYIAPELVRTNEPASPQSDVYSLGVLAYRMLTGKVPFSGDTAFEVLHRACFEQAVPLRTYAPEMPPEVEGFVLSMMAKEPNDRPATMQAVRDGLFELGCRTLEPQAVRPLYTGPFAAIPADASMSAGLAATARLTFSTDASPSTAHPSHPTEVLVDPMAHERSKAPVEVRSHSGAHRAIDATMLDEPGGASEAAGRGLLARRADEHEAGERDEDIGSSGGGRWFWGLVLGVVAALVVAVGAWVLAASRAEDPDETNAAESVRGAVEPARKETGRPGARLDEPDEPEPAEPEPEPTEPEPTEPEPTEPEPTEPGPTEPEPEPEPEAAEPRPEPRPVPPGHGRPSSASTNATIIKKLKKQIKARCVDVREGGPVTVSFLIQSTGRVVGLSVTPSQGPGKCAEDLVMNTAFLPPPKTKPIKLVVE